MLLSNSNTFDTRMVVMLLSGLIFPFYFYYAVYLRSALLYLPIIHCKELKRFLVKRVSYFVYCPLFFSHLETLYVNYGKTIIYEMQRYFLTSHVRLTRSRWFCHKICVAYTVNKLPLPGNFIYEYILKYLGYN